MNKILLTIIISSIFLFGSQSILAQDADATITLIKQDGSELKKIHHTTVGEIEQNVKDLQKVKFNLIKMEQDIKDIQKSDSLFDIELNKLKVNFSTELIIVQDSIADLKARLQNTNNTLQQLTLKITALENSTTKKLTTLNYPIKNNFYWIIVLLISIPLVFLFFYRFTKNN